MKRKFTLLGVALLLAACSNIGDLGSLGDILGSSGQSDQSVVRGTVTNVDTSARRIDLNVSYVNNLRDERANSSIYYDNDTTVEFGGRTYQVSSLERGDEIEARGSNQSGRYVADRIVVLRDVTR